jgi:hypothetical protein
MLSGFQLFYFTGSTGVIKVQSTSVITFDVLLTVQLSIILAIDQLDAQILVFL